MLLTIKLYDILSANIYWGCSRNSVVSDNSLMILVQNLRNVLTPKILQLGICHCDSSTQPKTIVTAGLVFIMALALVGHGFMPYWPLSSLAHLQEG